MFSKSIKTSFIGPLSFYKKALSIALPVILQLLVQSLVSLIDNFMVSGLGNVIYSSINVSNQLNMIIFVLLNSICAAGGIYISQFNGIKNAEGMQHAYRFKIIFTLLIATIYTFITYFFSENLMGFMLKDNLNKQEIVVEGSKYMKIIAFTWIPIALSFSIGSSMRESENVKTPLIISVIATLINTVLNWIFIYGNLGAPRLEVKGAAIATLCARLIELFIYLIYCYTKKPLFFSKWLKIFAIKASFCIEILKKSFLVIIANLSWILTETIMNRIHNGRGGAEIVAGLSAAWSIANLFQLVISGMDVSTAVVIGGTLGRGELDLAKKQSLWMKSCAIIVGTWLGFMTFFSSVLLPIVFPKISSEAIVIAKQMLFVIALYMPIWTFLNTQFATARAGGDAMLGTVTDLSVNTILFLPGILLLGKYTTWSPVILFAVVKISDIAKLIVAEWQLKKERWIKNLTTNQEV